MAKVSFGSIPMFVHQSPRNSPGIPSETGTRLAPDSKTESTWSNLLKSAPLPLARRLAPAREGSSSLCRRAPSQRRKIRPRGVASGPQADRRDRAVLLAVFARGAHLPSRSGTTIPPLRQSSASLRWQGTAWPERASAVGSWPAAWATQGDGRAPAGRERGARRVQSTQRVPRPNDQRER